MNEVYDNYTFFLTNIDSINEWVKNLANIFQQEYGIVGKNVFEAGASDGYFLSLFKEKNHIAGIEPSESLVSRAKEIYNIDIAHGYFGKNYTKKHDLVICRHVLEHIPDVESFIDALVSATDSE
jgi:2-polyprenyl-3-methyl-5-hydroxy-6-metoxy-1,4-benzoquinol methylase